MGNFTEIEQRIKEVFKVNKSIEISRLLNVSSSTYGNWKTRNTIPYDEIITLCEENKINMRYILTGNDDETNREKINYKQEIHKMIDDVKEEKAEIYYHLIKAELLKEKL